MSGVNSLIGGTSTPLKVVELDFASFSELALFTRRCSDPSGAAAKVEGIETSERSDHTSVEGFMLAAVSRSTTLGDQRKERIGNRKYAYKMNEGRDKSI